MGDFENKLESILNNPNAMSQIMALAQSLGTSDQEPAEPVSTAPASAPNPNSAFPLDPDLLNNVALLFNQYNQNDDQRIALLNALRPFVKEHRYAKLDKAIQIAKLSRLARTALELFRTKEAPNV